jgi:hypothetical protein
MLSLGGEPAGASGFANPADMNTRGFSGEGTTNVSGALIMSGTTSSSLFRLYFARRSRRAKLARD